MSIGPVKKLFGFGICRGNPIHEGRSRWFFSFGDGSISTQRSCQSSKDSRFDVHTAVWFSITKKLPVIKCQRGGARPDFYDNFATNIWDWFTINHLRVFYVVFEKERKKKKNTAEGERKKFAVITGARDLYHDEREGRFTGRREETEENHVSFIHGELLELSNFVQRRSSFSYFSPFKLLVIKDK